MNSINFTAKLTVNPNLRKTLKTSNVDEIIEKTKPIVEHPYISNFLDEDEIILSGLKNRNGEGLLIQIGNQKIEIKTKTPINPILIVSQILLYICLKNGVQPVSGSPERIFEAAKKLFEKN